VAKKTGKRVKHVPQRTCVGCRQTLAKRGMIRVVRTPEGLRVDSTGKIPGRGAYLHDRRSCWERGLKGALATALKIDLSVSDRELVLNFMNSLPEDTVDTAKTETATAETQPGSELETLGPTGNAL
jgi:uncharacterized protein